MSAARSASSGVIIGLKDSSPGRRRGERKTGRMRPFESFSMEILTAAMMRALPTRSSSARLQGDASRIDDAAAQA